MKKSCQLLLYHMYPEKICCTNPSLLVNTASPQHRVRVLEPKTSDLKKFNFLKRNFVAPYKDNVNPASGTVLTGHASERSALRFGLLSLVELTSRQKSRLSWSMVKYCRQKHSRAFCSRRSVTTRGLHTSCFLNEISNPGATQDSTEENFDSDTCNSPYNLTERYSDENNDVKDSQRWHVIENEGVESKKSRKIGTKRMGDQEEKGVHSKGMSNKGVSSEDWSDKCVVKEDDGRGVNPESKLKGGKEKKEERKKEMIAAHKEKNMDVKYNGNLKEGSYEFKTVEIVSSSVMEDVAMYSLKPMRQGYTCLVTRCPKLPPKPRGSTVPYGKLYINATSGHFQCDHCQQHGTWKAFQDNMKHLTSVHKKERNDFPCMAEVEGATLLNKDAERVAEYMKQCVPLSDLTKSELDTVLHMFQCNKLLLPTLDSYMVGFHRERQALVLPYYLMNNGLVGAKELVAKQKDDQESFDIQEKFHSGSGYAQLFGWNNIKPSSQTLIITASELDAMAIAQETKKPVLALPCGPSSLPVEVLPALERFKKIVLWFNNDMLSWKAVKVFVKKLGDKRCYVIRPSKDNYGPYKALESDIRLSKILRLAHPVLSDSIIGFPNLKDEVYAELYSPDMVAGFQWQRYTQLNEILKGHRPGEMTVLTGPTGSGKTTFLSEYSLDLCEQGVRTLWGSFEIPNVKLAKMMITQYAMKDMSAHLEEFEDCTQRFEKLPMFFMTFHGHQKIDSVLETMAHAVYINDIDHVILDNLQFMMGTNSHEKSKFAIQDEIVGQFRQFSTKLNCHITLVIHPRKEREELLTVSSIYGGGKAAQEADNILILQCKHMDNVSGRKYIQVVKNRFDGCLGRMVLKFDKESLTLSGKASSAKKLKQQMEVTNMLLSDNHTGLVGTAHPDKEMAGQCYEASKLTVSTVDVEDLRHRHMLEEQFFTANPRQNFGYTWNTKKQIKTQGY